MQRALDEMDRVTIAGGYLLLGMPAVNRVMEFADVDTAAAAVKSFLKNGDVMLLKASRSMRLERVGELLRERKG